MAETRDLVVIGTGSAASGIARRCRAAGWSVAVVDHRPFGGTCALRGCDPKKVLVGAAETLDRDRRMQGRGLGGGRPAIDWPALMAFKRTFTEPVPDGRAGSFAEAGIEAFRGRARFVGPTTVDVEGRRLEARFVVLAVGAVPRPLGIPGEEHLAGSDDFLDLDALPARIVMVGGGYIAAEFSHLAARAGARVTVLQRGDRILPHFDPDLVGLHLKRSAELGIDVRVDAPVEAVEEAGTGYRAVIADGGGTVEADLVVHAAGRVPDLDPLDLEAGGVEHEDGRLKLNTFLQSCSNPAVYAAGDAAACGPPLTPVASHDAKVVAANLLEGNRRTPDYAGVPSVVFAIPPLARVGLLEGQARRQHLRFAVKHAETSGWYSSRRLGEDCSGYKTLVEEDTGRILGAHLIGPHADEVINLFALAIRHGLTADRLADTMFGYPTGASDLSSML